MRPMAGGDNNPIVPPSIEEMAREMERLLGVEDDDKGGFTSREWARIWGVSYSCAKDRLDKLTEMGKIVTGQRRENDVMGRPHIKTTYRLKEEACEQ